jgi:hypothetical protein
MRVAVMVQRVGVTSIETIKNPRFRMHVVIFDTRSGVAIRVGNMHPTVVYPSGYEVEVAIEWLCCIIVLTMVN